MRYPRSLGKHIEHLCFCILIHRSIFRREGILIYGLDGVAHATTVFMRMATMRVFTRVIANYDCYNSE